MAAERVILREKYYMFIINRKLRQKGVAISLVACMLFLNSCEKQIHQEEEGQLQETDVIVTTAEETEAVRAVAPLGLNANVLPSIEGVTIDANAEELAPVNLTVGVINSVVRDLQQRLMDLGYMEYDEPTTYYGDATSKAIVHFQRQSGMSQDGITGVETWDAVMADTAPHYAVKLGFQGDDVAWIQDRLYNLGYLLNESDISGIFDEKTEAAVKKLQEINDLGIDGTVGQVTNNLLYSDEIKANVIAFGEQSELVKKYQERLIALGYLSGDADGNFGQGTQEAIKAFQSRNDQIVDGYLGAATRSAMDSSSAKPYAMRLGEQSDEVKNLQQLLAKYGYMAAEKASGYFGDLTKQAVIRFQENNGLTADGTAGAKTMGKLLSGDVKKYVAPSASTGRSSSSGGSSSSSSSSSGRSSSSSSSSSGASASYSGGGGATVSGSAGNLISIASSRIGCPYVYGAKGPGAFDCSGFVYWCLNQAGVGVSYMTSSGWRNPGRFKRVSFGELQAGDIIVVSGHVGICAGGGTVIDASSSNGRVVHRGLGNWWARNFKAGWRIFS